MNTSRRNFIETAGAGSLGIGFLPVYNKISNVFEIEFSLTLPRASPESQGISSKAISKFIAAANA